jgi:hypothetical protein
MTEFTERANPVNLYMMLEAERVSAMAMACSPSKAEDAVRGLPQQCLNSNSLGGGACSTAQSRELHAWFRFSSGRARPCQRPELPAPED